MLPRLYRSEACFVWGIVMKVVQNALMLLIVCAVLMPVTILAADDPLLMGVFPRRNVKLTHQMFTPLADHLSQQLSIWVGFGFGVCMSARS